jgi:hypothetical protein
LVLDVNTSVCYNITEGVASVTDGKQNRVFSGQKFCNEDLELIRELTRTYTNLSQWELASTICELIGWVQANGKPKTMQCTQFLHKLADEGEIKLPALRGYTAKSDRKKNSEATKDISWIDTSEFTESVPIKLEIVRPGEGLQQWRTYMSTYHRLGDPNVHGSQMRYTIRTEGGRDLGCMLFSASAWSLKPRDEWIGWSAEDRKTKLQLVVNHSRFLIFPWIRVKFLASRSLSMAVRRIQRDWLDDYCYAPVLIETFVDSTLYKGTSYEAANWICLGETQGRGRNDKHTERTLTKKAIFVYPLQRNFRAVLNGEKPWKAVEPHV